MWVNEASKASVVNPDEAAGGRPRSDNWVLGAGNHQPLIRVYAVRRSILLWPRMTYVSLQMKWFRLLK